MANSPDVRFVVISSDVVYPTGAMRDYEAKFWLPFKGVTRPVYAIPGNHDWYDALESFAATFLQPDAARASIHARVDSDLRVTSTTDGRIESLIHEAERLRREYNVPTGFQRAPFFEVQTERIRAHRDRHRGPEADRPAAGALARGRAAARRGEDHDGDRGPSLLCRRLRRHHRRSRIRTVETAAARPRRHHRHGGRHARSGVLRRTAIAGPADVHNFVNGGGGAYLSFGTALSWPSEAPTADWAHYPDRRAVAGKIEADTPMVETAGVVVDDDVRRVAVFRRMAVGGVRLQRRPVLPELRRGESRTVGTARARRAVRHSRPSAVGGLRGVDQSAVGPR